MVRPSYRSPHHLSFSRLASPDLVVVRAAGSSPLYSLLLDRLARHEKSCVVAGFNQVGGWGGSALRWRGTGIGELCALLEGDGELGALRFAGTILLLGGYVRSNYVLSGPWP